MVEYSVGDDHVCAFEQCSIANHGVDEHHPKERLLYSSLGEHYRPIGSRKDAHIGGWFTAQQ